MAIWKSRVSTGVRAYFKVVSTAGNLVTGLAPGLFTCRVINPADTAFVALPVTQSTQQAGVYYVNVPAAFLGVHGAGAYGLSLGIHRAAPPLNDEVLESLEVTIRDLDDIPTAVQNRDAILSDGIPFAGAFIDVPISSRAVPGDMMALTPAERIAVATAVWDLANKIETGLTPAESVRLMSAMLLGLVSGAPGLPIFKGAGVAATRVSMTADASGNRTVVVLTP